MGMPTNAQESDNFICKRSAFSCPNFEIRNGLRRSYASSERSGTRMFEIAPPPSRPATSRDARADKQAFAEVEKWMAMIRELGRERQSMQSEAIAL